MFTFNWLTPRFDMDEGMEMPGVESSSAAGETAPNSEASETGADTTVAADPEKQNNFEKAFAKRLADAQSKWDTEKQSEISKLKDQYKDYDLHKELSSWAQERTGADAMTLKDQIEMERLQSRAEQNETTPEMQRRLEALEAKAARADELEQKQAEDAQNREQQEKAAQWEKTYFDGISAFAKDKGIESETLNKFMIENQLMVNPSDMNKSFEIAMKAMKYDEVATAAAEAERKGMSKFLQSKGSIPQIKGSNAQAQVTSTAPKTFAEARARAMQREF